MAIPEGYEKLAVIGIAYKETYDPNVSYKVLNAVYYEGSTYVALKDNPTGPPAADGANWQYLARGFVEGVLNAINATDTSGLLGTAGAEVDAQDLMDVIADKVATKLIAKNMIVNNFMATDPQTVLSGPMGKELKDGQDQLNRDLGGAKITDNVYNSVPAGGATSVYGKTIEMTKGTDNYYLTINAEKELLVGFRNNPNEANIWKKYVSTSDFTDIPAVNIPAGQQVITPTNLIYKEGDMPIAYATGGHGVHMDIRLTVVAGVWNVTRRNTYSVDLDSTGVRLCIQK